MSKATAIYVRVSHRDQTHASQFPELDRGFLMDGTRRWPRNPVSPAARRPQAHAT